jgi:predicted NUDIX family NTP pyrophosphohydrolase
MTKRSKQSAGILLYRRHFGNTEVFLVHPGGSMWAKKDHGAWTIPKGEYDSGEEPLAAARREFSEETGFVALEPFLPLGSIRQKSGKVVTAWAAQGDCDPATLSSNTCEIEWPPRSGKRLEIPEIDRGGWFAYDRARIVLRAEQHAFLDTLESLLAFVEPS